MQVEQSGTEGEARGGNFLKVRGLELSAEKTRITTLHEGFDFLGFNVRNMEIKSH